MIADIPLYPSSNDDPVDQALAAFAHSPEHQGLVGRGIAPRHVRPLLEFAGSLWLAPADISGDMLVELLYDLPRIYPCGAGDVDDIASELHAFWLFAERELGYAHARSCLEVIATEAVQTLEHAIAAVQAHLREPPPGVQLSR